MVVGLIADTHGLMREEALRALRGVDLILHAGDVGRREVITALRALAQVRAVYGNVDVRDGMLADAVDCEIEGCRVHMSHGHELGSPTPDRLASRYPVDVVIYGHTHRAVIQEVGSTLVINPGAAGPRRFEVAPSVALLTLPGRTARIVLL